MSRRRYRAPGRVNLMGEHTDYSGGLVLPVAIDRYVELEVAPSSDGTVLRSQGFDGVTKLSPDGRRDESGPPWGRYVAAVHRELAELGRPDVGIRGLVRSGIPSGAGVSSSAAFEVALATAFCDAAEFTLAPKDLALACQRAEHRAVGVPCGAMDQLASTLGVAGHALRIDCGTLDIRTVGLPSSIAIVVIDSAVPRRLERTAYAERRAELERGQPARVRHVESENVRVDVLCGLLEATPLDRPRIGDVFAASHRSLAEDFEVSTTELDLLVALAVEEGAFAARLTGAGFGGSVVALVDAEQAAAVGTRVVARYRAETGRQGAVHVCVAVDGAARARLPSAPGSVNGSPPECR
jgi:galactokinase